MSEWRFVDNNHVLMAGVVSSGGKLSRVSTDWLIDSFVAAVSTFAAGVLHAEWVAGGADGRLFTPVFAVALVHGAAVLFRRHRPVPVLAVLLATAWLYVLLGFPAFMLGPGILFAMYSGGAVLPRPASLALLAVVEVNVVVILWIGPRFPGLDSVALYGGIIASAWGLGDLMARWRTAANEHARRADELAATREELARYAVTEERRRIARELHDVVAHSMTVVAMHAGTGRLVGTSDPASAVSSLATIEKLSRDALSEMRRLVGLLRDDVEEEELSPAPSLVDLHRLVGEVVAAGMVVEVHTEGPLGRVPPGPAVAAFRIIQEALTNAARHAGPARAELRVTVADGELVMVVRNDPPPGGQISPAESGGMGLIGMRERIQLYDGTLAAGLLPGGGYRVEARIPLRLEPG